jgi:hypothetical protein
MTFVSSPTWSYITDIITFNVAHLSSVGFFAHNDMDMMEIGNGNLTTEEQRTHFAAWIFLKSPILLGTDVSMISFGYIISKLIVSCLITIKHKTAKQTFCDTARHYHKCGTSCLPSG